jgi:DNA-binding transcriptional LysR family regulator
VDKIILIKELKVGQYVAINNTAFHRLHKAKDLIESGALVKPFDIQIEPGLKFSLLYDEESPRIARIRVFTEWLKQELLV